MNSTEKLNSGYLDLYGDSLKAYVTLPSTSTFEDIKNEVDKVKTIGYKNHFVVGGNCVIAERKYTFVGRRVIKTSYLHIFIVSDFTNNARVITRYREHKDGKFKTY